MWQIMLMISILFLVLEIFMPAMFFLNLAVAALISAVLALFIFNWEIIILAFALLSLAALFFLRPFLIKGKHQEPSARAAWCHCRRDGRRKYRTSMLCQSSAICYFAQYFRWKRRRNGLCYFCRKGSTGRH